MNKSESLINKVVDGNAADITVTETVESVSRYCSIYKARNGKWYLELADKEYGEYEDAYTYGPFDSEVKAEHELNNYSNPGSVDTDSSGSAPVPIKSPNGSPIRKVGKSRMY